MRPWYLEDPIDVEGMYFQYPHTTLDLETTNKEKGSPLVPENRIVLAAAQRTGWLFASIGEPRDILPRSTVLVAHNAKFEIAWLNRTGIDTSQYLVWDTMLAEYVLAGNRRVPLDLGSVCRRYGLPAKEPVVDSLMAGGVCPSEMPRHLLEARVLRDVETTERIFQIQREVLRKEGLLNVMFTRSILVPVLAEIEATGLFVDKAAVSKETRRVLAELRASEARLGSMTGGINLRSTAQMAHYLYGAAPKETVHPDFASACAQMEGASRLVEPQRSLGFTELKDRRGNPKRNAPTKQFPQGLPRTDADTLDKLEATTEEQRDFVKARAEFGDWNARYGKTLQCLEEVAKNHECLLYGKFNQTVARNHRTSSSGRKIPVLNPETGKKEEKGIQFQNFPREYKKLFTVRDPDYVYIEVDGSQLEFRVAAFLGQDMVAAKDIVDGKDVHLQTASTMFQIPESEVKKKQRDEAKPDTFGPLYNKQRGTKAQVRYFEFFREKYHAIETEQKRWVTEVLKTGKLVTVTGLTFYFPGCKVTSSGYVEHSPSIYNYQVSMLATADIIPISLTLLFWAVKEAGLRVLFTNTVHDSVAAEVHKDDEAEFKRLAEKAFLEDTYAYLLAVYGIKFNVPLGVATTVGTHLGTGTETKVSRASTLTPPLVGNI